MEMMRWVAALQRRRRTMILVALVTTFAGVALLIDRPKGTILEWLAIPFVIVGGGTFAWAVWPLGTEGLAPTVSAASHFVQKITWGGRFIPLFPAIAVAIVLADLGYNLKLSGTPALQTEDIMALLLAATLMAYNLIPSRRLGRERDFVLLFFLSLNLVLVAPLLAARAFSADFQQSVDVYSWVALAPETSAVLSLVGVTNSVHAVSGSTAPGLTFTPQHFALPVTIVITTACSGIYSFGIFASAFLAFVLTEHNVMTRRVWALLGLGIITSYLANVLRMVVIVLVGYYTDTAQTDLQNMLIAHSYLGWLIFLAWISLFWMTLLHFLQRGEDSAQQRNRDAQGLRHEARCEICSEALTPSLPATRCECGSYSHVSCLVAAERCPTCGRILANPKTHAVGT